MFRPFTCALGLAAALLLSGCGRTSSDEQAHQAGEAKAPAESHDHASEGPHGGHLVELGDCVYHAELLHDEATHTVTVYLLDAAGKQEVAVDTPEIELQVFQDGEFIHRSLKPAGDGPSSQFTLVDETVCDLLLHAKEVHGRLSVVIDGQMLVGTIEHQTHDHDAHDHDAHDGETAHDHDGETAHDHDAHDAGHEETGHDDHAGHDHE